MRSFGPWVCLTMSCFGVAASCGSSDEKHAVGGDDQGGSGGDGATNAGRAGSNSAGSAVTTAGSQSVGGDAGGGGLVPAGGADGVGGNPAGDGGVGGQAPVAGQGGVGESHAGNGGAGDGGAAGAGGAACCSASAYQSSSQLLPSAVCSAWQLTNNADSEVPQLLGGNLRLSTSTVGENQFYWLQPANLTVPAKLVLEARMQLISGSASTGSRAPANFGFVLGDKKNLLMIGSGEIFLLSSENVKGASAAVATTDGMHVYRMEVDTALGSVEVFYDGQSKLTGSTFVDLANQPDFLYFGEGSTYGTSVSDWAYFTHNAYTCAD